MATQPTHLELFFLRSVRVRKEHIQGQADDGDGNLMRIVVRGEKFKIRRDAASDLIIAESAVENTSVNRDKIDAAKAQFAEEDKVTSEPPKKKAA